MSSPNQGLFRLVTRDTTIGGVDVAQGSTIWVMFGAANRDERAFADGETFDDSTASTLPSVAADENQIGVTPEREVIVYCQSGGRSAMAKRLLEANGYSKVHDMGGIGQW